MTDNEIALIHQWLGTWEPDDELNNEIVTPMKQAELKSKFGMFVPRPMRPLTDADAIACLRELATAYRGIHDMGAYRALDRAITAILKGDDPATAIFAATLAYIQSQEAHDNG